MIPRILHRTHLALKRNLPTIGLLAGAVLVAGIIAWRVTPHAVADGSGDCADVVMTSLDGPNESATRLAFDCLAPSFQARVGSVDTLVASNASFPVATHTRVAESASHSDGTHYVFFDSNMGTQHNFYVIELDSTGHVVSIG